jgi:hypothetical protein
MKFFYKNEIVTGEEIENYMTNTPYLTSFKNFKKVAKPGDLYSCCGESVIALSGIFNPHRNEESPKSEEFLLER